MPLGGIDVTITSGPQQFLHMIGLRERQFQNRWASLVERPDRTRTRADGHYHFLDLPDGAYTLDVSWPAMGSCFGSAEYSFSITRTPDETINRVVADIALAPTTLMGTVTDENSDPVLMAEVLIRGSNERTFTDSDGQYLLTGLEIGTRTVLVTSKNHGNASQTVVFAQAGSAQTVNFSLTMS